MLFSNTDLLVLSICLFYYGYLYVQIDCAILQTRVNSTLIGSNETIVNNNDTIVDPDTNSTNNSPAICTDGSYVANSENCSTFFACENGGLKEARCPPHMWFDPNYKGNTLCNHPEVICAADNGVCDCAQKYPPLKPDPLMEPSITCLMDNRFHLRTSNVECGRYFVCFNEKVFRMECRPGFHFNPKAGMCDYPELVNCRVSFWNHNFKKYL